MSKITLVILKNPFNHEGREIRNITFVPGKTIAQYVQPYTMGLDDFIYSAQGVKVEGEYVPEPGDYLAVCPVVGKSKILGSLLSIGLAVWTGGLAEGGFWGLKAGSFAAGLAASAIAYVGGMVINHLFPPATPDVPDSTSSTPTYGWGNISAQVTQGGVLPRTYGTMRSAGIEVSRYVSVNGDKQYLNVLYTGGQGPIDDITDIEINGNPVSNFQGVQVETRLGTNDQAIIANFGDTFIGQSLNYELQESAWSTQLIDGNAAQGLQVMIEFPNGLFHMSSSGKLKNAWVKLAAEYRVEGGVWTPWISQSYVSSSGIEGATCYPNAPGEIWTVSVPGLFGIAKVTGSISGDYNAERGQMFDNGKIKCKIPIKIGSYTIAIANNTQITAKQNTAVRRTFRIDNIPAGRYEVRMKVIDRSASVKSTKDSVRVYWNQLSQIIYDDFSRPNKILIGIRALATDQLNGNDITITWKQHKKTVWVWNPSTESYEEKNARNHAWVCYDMIHGARRLINTLTGQYEFIVDNVPASRMDYQAFSDWAAHIETLGIEFEHTFDAAADLWSALKAPETFGRGKVIMKGTRFSCVCDKPSTPVQLFTVGNIDQGSFSKDYLGLTDRANAIEITFVNREKGYQKDAFTVYGDDYNDSVVQNNPTQITLNGCTDYKQAYQHGKYMLRLNKYLLRTTTWEADIDAIACQVGDQVLLQHDVPEWGVGGRLVEATATTLTLDKPVTMEPGKTYGVYVRLIDDTLVSKYVINTGTETDVLTVTTAFAVAPQEYDIFAFGEIEKRAKPFIVVSVDRKDDLACTLTGIEYVPAVYEESLDAPVIQYSAADMTPPEVSGLSVDQETYRQKDGTVISVIKCSWQLPQKPIKGVIIYYREEADTTWQSWISQQETFAAIPGVTSLTTYQVKVCTISTDIGVVSPGVLSEPIYITGKDYPPSNVPAMSINQVGESLHVSIVEVNEPDVETYELRLGASWSNSALVQQFIGSKLVVPAPYDGTLTYWVKAIDWSGNYSAVATKAIVNVSGLPIKNIIFTQDTIPADWVISGLWMDSTGRYRLESAQVLGDYERFSDVFFDAPTYRKDASIILPIIDLGESALDESCYWVDTNGDIQLKSVQTLGDFERFSDIFSMVPEYVTPQYVTETFVSIQPTYTVSGNARLEIEYRTSLNGVNWGPWTPSTIRQFNNRYVQVRLLPQSLDDVGQVYVTGAKVTIDVPDIEETIERLAVPNVKTRVYFTKKFTEVKSIVLWTFDNTGKSATCQKSNETNEYFDIEILDNNDNPIAGVAEKIVIRGY